MDRALSCTSGYVELGHWSRVGVDVGLCLGCVVLAALAERLRYPYLSAPPMPSLLLNATSVYSLELTNWTVDDHVYLDRMSAAMTGLFTWRVRGVMHVFDIKSWRHFTATAESKSPLDPAFVLPLHRI
ncbi:hypothetical protein SPRG_15311 [Saprolegnia parasitica CBS 223.65]|uniref:Uncharacterized protein n=1 Tax=Saprolegnia parasitica (strain CBS 223.65) TaxID=695850 RepID=A0A067BJW1_SAPPC|nr:hypothetical protein SPRG_15311 [Saprolegnia parasitica CBS 223.65]KDO18483.1 hypothetical protein SPRG_15311 [Saprolegnia parasitica CBS 223.65]|eukprot:XP_012210802.1 hypothetical protein SPRG_15311 [Saprolegnia parasitica CBS 223.65]